MHFPPVCNKTAKHPIRIRILMILVLCCFLFVLILSRKSFIPKQIRTFDEITSAYEKGWRFAVISSSDFYYTGYDYIRSNQKLGSYYFSIQDNTCLFVLLKDRSNAPPAKRHSYSVSGRLCWQDQAARQMLHSFAKELEWKEEELTKLSLPIMISEI